MSTVYQHQLHAHKVRRHHYKIWLAVLILLGIGVYVAAGIFLKPNTKISKAKVVTSTISGQTRTQHFNEGMFSIDLPVGWQFMGTQHDIYTIYHFRNSQSGDQGDKLLDVYQNNSLPNFAVNRLLPVEATDDGKLLANVSDVSDNCSAYTTGPTSNRSTVAQQAKWEGITFLCDMANPLRNVVGIGSKDGLNTVVINSLSSGKEHYFLTYTENNDKPNYGIFVAAINSFQVAQ